MLEGADRIRIARQTQSQTVTAITAPVEETDLAADSMSGNVAAIRRETESVASEIDALGRGFDTVTAELSGLERDAGAFARKVAA